MDEPNESFEAKLTRYRAHFAPYTLTMLGAWPARLFQLRKPGEPRCGGVDIVVLGGDGVEERILVTGDLCPSDNGAISVVGYGLGWFAGRASGDYLCGVFVHKVWVPERARAALRDTLAEAQKDLSEHEEGDAREPCSDARCATYKTRLTERIAKLTEAVASFTEHPGSIDDPTRSASAFDDFWREVVNDDPEGTGYGYDPRNAALLTAIHETFARLYWAEQAKGELPLYPDDDDAPVAQGTEVRGG